MALFVIQADEGCFLSWKQRVTKLTEQTNFYIFAENMDQARLLSEKYIAELIGQGSEIANRAIYDPVGDWVRRVDAHRHLEIIEETVAEASRFIGTIAVESYAVKSPQFADETLFITLTEGDKRRCLIDKVHFMEDGSVKRGEEMTVFDAAALASAIQQLF